MKNTARGPGLCAVFGNCLLALTLHADGYVWDNGGATGIWNDSVNWGKTNNAGYNVAPTALDGAIFLKNFSPSGTVRLNADGIAQYLRQDSSRAYRTITIHSNQTVDRTLTLSGTAPALIDGWNAWVDFTFDGTPNGNGARLKLKIDGSGTDFGTRINKAVTLRISCDVSGAGGFNLTAGEDGPGRLILSGADSYSGPTTVGSGILLINGSTETGSAVTVNSGGILGGAGTIGGLTTVNAGGLISPGINSQAPIIGTLTVSNDLILAGDLQVELNKFLSQSNDMVFVSGQLTNAGLGVIQVLNYGDVLSTGDRFQVFNQPLENGEALKILSAGREVWTNKLAVDGSIEVISAANTPMTGNPKKVFTWNGSVTTDQPWKVPTSVGANWVGNQAPAPNSSNVFVFAGDILVPYQWPYIDTSYGTTILIFSNNIALNSIKILAGSNNTVNLGSYVRQDSGQPCYFGITEPVRFKGADNNWYWVTNAHFTNALGDASCGSLTEFQCTGGGWLAVYGVLRDGAGTSSRLVKSGNASLNLTGYEPNTYSGGTLINGGSIKMSKPTGVDAIPGDVTVNGSGGLDYERLENTIYVSEQIADTSIITLNDAASFQMRDRAETVQTIQSTSPRTSILNVTNLTVAPSSSGNYNAGAGESQFAGSISGSGTFRMNGTGTYGMQGINALANLVVNSGTLKVNGNSGSGVVAINSGGSLLGQGTMAGSVTVADGGTIGAGFSVGQLTLSAGLNLSASGDGATNVWELAALKDGAMGVPGGDFDQIVLTGGALTLSPQATLDIQFTGSATAPHFSEPFWQSPHTWRIIQLSGGSNPTFSNFGRIKNDTYPAGTFSLAADAGGILLSFTPALRIMGITGAGTASVTVHYTNALPGTNYVLTYRTNLNSPIWFPAGNKTAAGTSDSQTDTSTSTAERYYRVYQQ